MTTSGTNTFNLVRNQIIDEAYSLIGIKTPGRILTADEVNEAVTSLNLRVKTLKSKGRYLWKTAQGTLFLIQGQAAYTLDGSTANAADTFAQTAISINTISGVNSITVSDVTGIAIGYFIGVYLDNNTLFWTTVTNVVGNIITLASPISYSTSVNNVVYAYETKINRPEAIISARARDSNGYDIPMVEWSQDEYNNMVNKTTQSRPLNLYYDKQLTYGVIYLWPTPNSVTDTVKFTYEKMFEDAGDPTDNLDFPVEWTDYLTFDLAFRLGIKNGVGGDRLTGIKTERDNLLGDLEAYDRERYTSLRFEPNLDNY
jgi:hypothetical protein